MIVVMSASEWSLTARWIFPVDAPPLERGVVTIAGDRIASVEPRGTRNPDYDLGNAAILPGLVNAHTHLDLSGLRGKCPPTPEFTNWLRAVIRHRRNITTESIRLDIREGLAEAVRCGTTLLGDITVGGVSWSELATAPLRSSAFYEMLGLTEECVDPIWRVASAWAQSDWVVANCRSGLSPHAPYSTHASLFTNANEIAQKSPVPLTTHLAETRAELELLEKHSGEFVSFLKELEVWNPDGLLPHPIRAMRYCCMKGVSALLIHCNYLPSSAAVPRSATIVYCPRTHAAFGHPPHPFREFLARGVRVALGTDSLASNPDLDVLAEARFVHAKHPDVAGDVLLRMVTLSGAEALGWADETGSLTPGKSADLVVLPLPNEESSYPHNLVFESTLPVRGVHFRGQWTRAPTQPG
jgi:cytosine/adenosine deaminase-related metal-dependent hydrolase